jgi:hypothetical protein
MSGTVIVLAGLLYSLSPQKSADEIQNISFSAGQLNFMMGAGDLNADKMVIDGFTDGFAVLSSGPVEIDTQLHPILFLELEMGEAGPQVEQAPVFFWRQKNQSGQVSRLTLDGSQMINLGNINDWQGAITEIGFMFQETGGKTTALGKVSLNGRSLQSNIKLTLEDWFQFEPWTQISVNFLKGGAATQSTPLPIVLLLWILVCFLTFFLSGHRNFRGLLSYGLAIVLVAWMMLDIRWTLNGSKQMQEAISNRWNLSDHDRLLSGPDGEIYALIDRFKGKMLEETPKRIVIVGDKSAYSYYLMRTKYHLLPDGALIRDRLSRNIKPDKVDYVIFVDDFASQKTRWNDIWLQLPMDDAWRDSLKLVDSGPLGVLFSVESKQ